MKKYLLLIEDEKLWNRFKSLLKKDINTEIMELIKKKVNKGKSSSHEEKKTTLLKKALAEKDG